MAACPRCGYETLLFEDDVTEIELTANTAIDWSIHLCPECDPADYGDPTTDRTPRLELKKYAQG